jgi:hypothetical protein
VKLALGLLLAAVLGLAWALHGSRGDPRAIAEPGEGARASDGGSIPATPGAATTDATAPAELEVARARIVELEEQVARLRATLDAAETDRIAREQEFLRFTQGIAQLGTLAGATMPTFETRAEPQVADGKAEEEPVPAPPAVPDPTAVRSREIFLALRALLAAEQVVGLDLLESGHLQEGFTGPIVMRTLDDRGRPLGSLTAERLRLEASRAARMVTIVLEHGAERRDGVRVPFDGGPADAEGRGGQRRIVLADCDPKPWIEGLPELFPSSDRDPFVDDGRYELGRLRATLNTLLLSESGASRESGTGGRASEGWYRLQGLGGVQGAVLRDVALDQLDRDGRIERRFFADRMVILREAKGLQILLEGGSQVRGDEKTPFLDGRYRIFLPRAATNAWEKAGLPGLAPAEPKIPPAPEPTEPRKP